MKKFSISNYKPYSYKPYGVVLYSDDIIDDYVRDGTSDLGSLEALSHRITNLQRIISRIIPDSELMKLIHELEYDAKEIIDED